jgi:hypothetical protein
MTTSASRESHGALRSALGAVVVSALVLSLLAFYFFGVKGLLGGLAGGVIAFVNLWAVARVVRGILEESRFRARWSLLALLKMTGLFAAVFALFSAGLPILAIAIGYASLPIGIVIGQLWAPAPADDDTAPNKG